MYCASTCYYSSFTHKLCLSAQCFQLRKNNRIFFFNDEVHFKICEIIFQTYIFLKWLTLIYILKQPTLITLFFSFFFNVNWDVDVCDPSLFAGIILSRFASIRTLIILLSISGTCPRMYPRLYCASTLYYSRCTDKLCLSAQHSVFKGNTNRKIFVFWMMKYTIKYVRLSFKLTISSIFFFY